MARCSSRSEVKTSVRPSSVVTFQKSSLKSPSLRRILNLWPQFVHLTVVPRPLTSASSNSYSVLHRSHLTSIVCARPRYHVPREHVRAPISHPFAPGVTSTGNVNGRVRPRGAARPQGCFSSTLLRRCRSLV